jgi:hypothetical protein
MGGNRFAAPAETVPMTVDILERDVPGRAAAEDFIRAGYRAAYGAELQHFLVRLMTVHAAERRLLAALGFRRARAERLFLEQYLNRPVEEALGAARGRAVARYGLVEVGNFVSPRAGGARWLIAALTAYLRGAGYDWAVFTATAALRNSFARLGVELVHLGDADVECLAPAERAHWGSYYDTRPTVVAANVAQSFAALPGSLALAEDRFRLRSLWQHAFATGLAPCYA